MHKKIDALKSDYAELVQKKLFKVFDKVIKTELSDFTELESRLHQTYGKKKVSREELISIKKSVLDHTSGYWSEPKPVPFEKFAEEFLNDLTTSIEKFPEKAELTQPKELFMRNDRDSFIVSILKPFKIFFWHISQLPNRLRKKEITYWKHKVPLWNVLMKHLVYQVYQDTLPLLISHYKTLMGAYKDLYAWEISHEDPENLIEPPDLSEALKKETAKNKRELKKQLKSHIEYALGEMQFAMDRVGTIELSPKKYRGEVIEKQIQKLGKKWVEQEKGWVNTFDVFLESWRSELTLQTLILQTKGHLDLFVKGQSENISMYVGSELDEIDGFIQQTIDQIEQAGDSLSSVLKQCIYKARKSLDQKIIPDLLEKIGNKNMVNGIARLKSSIFSELEDLNAKRRTAKEPTDFLEPLKDDEITTTSPQDLIKFESASKLSDKVEDAKAELVKKLNENQEAAQDIDHMILYGLTASLDECLAKDDISTATTVALKSLSRSTARVKDIRDSLQKCIDEANGQIIQAINEYNDSLKRLTRTENFHEVRLRIIKAKALQSTEEYKNVLVYRLSNIYKDLIGEIKKKLSVLDQWRTRLSRRFNLTSDDEVDIEVTNFLVDSLNLIESLPLIYRNLYQITPVTDQELFVGRKNELTQLKEAYQYWSDKKKGAAAIIGEKWSGLTSLVNMIDEGDYLNYRCNRFATTTTRNTKEELFTFFGEILDKPVKDDSSWSEIADLINAGTKKVIIIEDVHRLYIRKIGGFDLLLGLAELIQATAGQVFWIVTCNLYIWEYLLRTVQFDEFFRYQIELQPPSETEIEDLIQKRNRISGYKPYFVQSEGLIDSKKFQNSTEEEQQKLLKEKFFRDLIRYSSSNISMALMFYLLSTEEIEGDRIKISEFKRPDFTFLTALPMEKVTTLHQLILHDGLTIEQFSGLARINASKSKMLMGSMNEDGILIKNEGFFVVNPLIYKSVISLLKAKNLL